MFENAELGHRVDKPTYAREAPRLRAALLEAQRELAEANSPAAWAEGLVKAVEFVWAKNKEQKNQQR